MVAVTYGRATVARNVERLRGELGMSRDELARRSGLGPVVVERVLEMYRDVTLEEAFCMASALGCTVDDLLVVERA